MFKRVMLFLLTNILILLTISIILRIFNVQPYINAYGIDYTSLMVYCLVWGFAGAFISLALSRVMAKFAMGVKVIDPQQAVGTEAELVRIVHRLAQAAGLNKMPEVGIYESPEVNAFATGPTKNRSLVAVSSGLLNHMGKNEIEGVLGHEIAHVANGDMVTLTLLQGVVNAFVLFFAKVIAWAISNAMRGENDRSPSVLVRFAIEIVLQIAFGILGSMVVAYFSRIREFRADKGGAQFAGRERMIAALRSLQSYKQLVDGGHKELAAFKINGGGGSKFMQLISTHPPLEVRIERLQHMI